MSLSRVREVGIGITRNDMIVRATSWLRPSVAYSQTEFHSNEHGCYRTDCSGYLSLAWGLPGRPVDPNGGLNTVGLLAVSVAINRDELLDGDALLCPEGTNLTRHVTLFEKWVDGTRRAYWGFEQASGSGTAHRTIHYPYEGMEAAYEPRRYHQVVEIN